MTYEEVKQVLKGNISKYVNSLFPDLSINFKALIDYYMNDLEKLMDDKKVDDITEQLTNDTITVASRIRHVLIMENISKAEMDFITSLNYLIWNWAKATNTEQALAICAQNDILVETQFDLKRNITIMRQLVVEAERILAFKPKDMVFSGMYLEKIDKYFEFMKKNKLDTYGSLNPDALKQFEKEKNNENDSKK